MNAHHKRKVAVASLLAVCLITAIVVRHYNGSRELANSEPPQSAYRVLQVKLLRVDPGTRTIGMEWKDPKGAIQRFQGQLDPRGQVKVHGQAADLSKLVTPADAAAIVRIDVWQNQTTTTTITSIEQ